MQFTEDQLKVIHQISGRVIVIACPGSGKTTTILARTQHMIEAGIAPDKILVVTFTKNAAVEMKERFQKQCQQVGTVFCTIHSLCFSVLRHHDNLDARCILKEWEPYKFFRDLLSDDVAYEDMEAFSRTVLSDISYVKNARLNPAAYEVQYRTKNGKVDFSVYYHKYEDWKKQQGRIDFDDMLLMCHHIFTQDKQELELWQEMYPYVIIDEYQDTNIIQSEIFYMLSGKHGNLCVVGDDDQSIYGFRSADSSIMLNFEKQFPDAKRFSLDTNYRSGKEIIREAGNLIGHNHTRFPKDFKAFHSYKGRVLKHRCPTSEDAVEYILDSIETARNKGLPYEEMAVLFRMNKQAVPVIAAFLEAEIPFHTNDTVPDIHKEFFFQDIRHYYALANDMEDQKRHLQFVLNHPSRYLKKTDFANCEPTEEKMLQQIKRLCITQGKYEEKAEQLRGLFRLIRSLRGCAPSEFVKRLFNFRYEAWVEEYAKFMHRDIDNVLTSYEQVKKEAGQFKTMEEWLTYADAYAEMLREKKEKKEGIALSTFHGAKGLEWQKIFILDADEGITPHKKAVSDAEIEEERRMFYVAITRTKDELDILYRNPSYFLKEMEDD